MTPAHRSRGLLAALTLVMAGMAYCAAWPAWWPGMVIAAAGASGLIAWLWQRDAVTMRQVLVMAVLFRLLFFALPPELSDDAYRYVWDGYLQTQGINPYQFRPEADRLASFQEEPVFRKLNSAAFYSVYPPVSQLIFRVGGWFYEGGWRVSYYVIKGLFLLLEIGGLFLLARLTSARALLLYAWQPLILLEVAGQGHTEAALVFFLTGTVWAARRDRPALASVLLAGAGAVKLYPFVLFPLLWRRFGGRAVWPGGLAAALVAVPYVQGEMVQHMADSLALYVRSFEFNAGLYYGLKRLLYELTGSDWSKTLGPLLQALFILSLPLCFWWDARAKWPLEKAMLIILGAFFVLATTVHPWYLVGVLALTPLFEKLPWHWHALALGALGTYLFYIGGPYWPFVIAGWGGWLVLAGWRHGDDVLQRVQRVRARSKARLLAPFLPDRAPLDMLDLGAGEGYVGEVLQRRHSARVVLVDVLPLNRTKLPFHQYDGRTLPFDDDAFNVTLLVFVLHHCEDPERVLREALRVTRDRVIIVESVYERPWQRRLLRLLDRWANRLRSHGQMASQEEHLRFRRAEAWRALFEAQGATVRETARRGRLVHRQAVFILETG